MDDDVAPLSIVECKDCEWSWYFYDRRPTLPFTCSFCKMGTSPWPYERRETPSYGIPTPKI